MIVNTEHVNAFYRQLQQIIKPLLDELVSDKSVAEVTKDRDWFRLVHIRSNMVTQWLVYIHSNGSRATLLKLSAPELDRLAAEISRVAQGLLHIHTWEDAPPFVRTSDAIFRSIFAADLMHTQPTLQQLLARLRLPPSVAPPS